MMIKCFLVEFTGRYSDLVDGVGHGIFKRLDTGEEIIKLNDHPGAMYYASEDNQKFYRPGPDGKTLFVVTPGGTWNIDSRASNCGLPNDNIHYCWCRHGIPPDIEVDKNCSTCKAGAGSIQIGSFHGYIRKGGYLSTQ